VVSSKGGVGKTTTAVNLGAGLAARGHNVLVVDLDCQASASLSLGLQRHQLAPSAADVLLRNEPAGKAVRPSRLPGLWVLPASADLSSVEGDLASLRTKERVLARALEPMRERFDHILIDCPPGMGLLTRNALVASDVYLVPAVPQFLAVEGLENLVQAVARLDFRMQARTHLLGIVATMVDLRIRSVRDNLQRMRDAFGTGVFALQVRINARLAEAPAHGATIFEHDPSSVGAHCHRLLAEEFLLRLPQALPGFVAVQPVEMAAAPSAMAAGAALPAGVPAVGVPAVPASPPPPAPLASSTSEGAAAEAALPN
jgi:chromosome partitioning protein